jgi:hypothetical protein
MYTYLISLFHILIKIYIHYGLSNLLFRVGCCSRILDLEAFADDDNPTDDEHETDGASYSYLFLKKMLILITFNRRFY